MCVRGCRRQLVLHEEVIGGGGGGFEIQPLHGSDAALRPEREQHQRHRGAIPVEVLFVLPHGPPTALLLADSDHGRHEGLILGPGVLALVPREVPASPPRHERRIGGGERAPPVDATVEAASGQGPQRQPEQDEDHDGGGDTSEPAHPTDRPGEVPCHQRGDQSPELGDPDPSEEVQRQVVEGGEAGVPQAPLGHAPHAERGHHGDQRQCHTGAPTVDERQHEADDGESDDPLQWRGVDETAVERLAGEGRTAVPQQRGDVRLSFPPHVVEVGPLCPKRPVPPRHEEPGNRHHRRQPQPATPPWGAAQPHEHRHRQHGGEHDENRAAQPRTTVTAPPSGNQRHQRHDSNDPRGDESRHHRSAGPTPPHRPRARVNQEQRSRSDHGEDCGDDVAEGHERQQAGRQPTMTSGAQAPSHHAEEDQRQRQGDRKSELSGQRRCEIAPVDRERTVKEERRRTDGEERWRRERESGQASEGPRSDRHGDHTTHRHQLEGDAVGQHVGQQGDRQHRRHHVEVERREPGVPVRGPPGEPERREQVVAHERRAPHVGAHVPAGGSGVSDEEGPTELRDDETDTGGDDPQRQPTLHRDRRNTMSQPGRPPGIGVAQPPMGIRIVGLGVIGLGELKEVPACGHEHFPATSALAPPTAIGLTPELFGQCVVGGRRRHAGGTAGDLGRVDVSHGSPAALS